RTATLPLVPYTALVRSPVLEEKPHDGARQSKPPAVHAHAKDQSSHGECRGIDLERPLDVPFAVQLVDPTVDRPGAGEPVSPHARSEEHTAELQSREQLV